MPEKYHVALSFAGEDRAYVGQVAEALQAEGVDVFYDKFEEADLWGKDLYVHLSDIYQNRAVYTVIFISEAYGKKLWTRVRTHNHQMMAAARATAPMKFLMLRSKRVAMRRQSLKRQNMRSMTLRCL